MNAPITPADRAAAEKALRDLWFECGKKPRDPNGGVDVVAAAIADARETERNACETIARDRASRWAAALESQNPRRASTWTRRDEAMYLADRIAQRRSR